MVQFLERSGAELCVRLTPNRSISRKQLLWVFAAVAMGCISFPLLMTIRGWWFSLPIAGAEVLALGLVLRWVRREQERLEDICIARDAVSITRCRRGRWDKVSFPSAWLRVELRPGPHRWYPRRLMVSSHGRELEIGRFLPEAERQLLAERLTELTGSLKGSHGLDDTQDK